jgi:hypothetical protein
VADWAEIRRLYHGHGVPIKRKPAVHGGCSKVTFRVPDEKPTASDAYDPPESCRSPETVAVHPNAWHWTSVCIDGGPGFENWMHLYVGRTPWSVGRLDPLLRQVADDVIANVLVADTGLGWLYHPYDGGMDVLRRLRPSVTLFGTGIPIGSPRTQTACNPNAGTPSPSIKT